MSQRFGYCIMKGGYFYVFGIFDENHARVNDFFTCVVFRCA